MELEYIPLEPSYPDHVQRSRPKARLRVEMPASMPARKFRSFLHTHALFAMSETDRPRFLAKTASLIWCSLAKARFSFEAKPHPHHLPGHAALPCLVLGKEGLVLIGVGGVAPHDETPEDHGELRRRGRPCVRIRYPFSP